MRHHLELRDDQVVCVQQAIAQNSVVHLRTGGGKTLVAVRVIDHFLRAARARADAGVADDAAASPPQRIPQHQQVVVFVVPTRVLVAQQARYCREHMHVDVDAASVGTRVEGASVRVAELCGNEMDRWTEARWARCISDHEVLVGTAEVFRKAMVDHAFLKMAQVCLLVLDECHYATGNSPMAAIMRDAYHPSPDDTRPRVLGLTASFVNGSFTNDNDLKQKRAKLETLLLSTFCCPAPLCDRQAGADGTAGTSSKAFFHVHYAADALGAFSALVRAEVKQVVVKFPNLPLVKNIEQVVNRAEHVFTELGTDGLQLYLREGYLRQLHDKADELAKGVAALGSQAKALNELHIPALREALLEAAANLEALPALRAAPRVSSKCQKLLDLVAELLSANMANQTYKGIVFVQQIALTYPLRELLSRHLHAQGSCPCVCVSMASGSSSMASSICQAELGKFEKGESRVMVSTSALEEGLDVPECAFVVRFSPFQTTKSHIQGSGRARQERADVYYFDNCPPAELASAAQLTRVAQDAALELSPEELVLRRHREQARRAIPEWYPRHHKVTGATINLYNCEQLVRDYFLQTLGHPNRLATFMKYTQTQTHAMHPMDGDGCVPLASVRYPCPSPERFAEVTSDMVNEYWEGVDISDLLEEGRAAYTSAADLDRLRFLYVVAVYMSDAGYLDSFNLPSERVVQEKQTRMADLPELSVERCGVTVRNRFPADIVTARPNVVHDDIASPVPPRVPPSPLPSLADTQLPAEATTPGSISPKHNFKEAPSAFQGDPCPSRKAAEQSAAKAAMDHLRDISVTVAVPAAPPTSLVSTQLPAEARATTTPACTPPSQNFKGMLKVLAARKYGHQANQVVRYVTLPVDGADLWQSSPGFQCTVTLSLVPAEELRLERQFQGEARPTRRAAEQSAAKLALDHLVNIDVEVTVPDASPPPSTSALQPMETEASPAATPDRASPSPNFKSQLNETAMKHLCGRSIQQVVQYVTRQTSVHDEGLLATPGFQCTVTLSLIPAEEPREFEGAPCHARQAAEQSAAKAAVVFLMITT